MNTTLAPKETSFHPEKLLPVSDANGLPHFLSHISPELVKRAQQVKLVVTDVDGVLTPSSIIWDAHGTEQKEFHVKDGWALKRIKQLGLHTAIITGRASTIVALRGKELDFDFVYQAVRDKSAVLDKLLEKLELTDEQVAYVGDDIPDYPVIKRVGLSACPADASPEIQAVAHIILNKKGGAAALREFLDIIRYALATD